jgi:hypothetical protein
VIILGFWYPDDLDEFVEQEPVREWLVGDHRVHAGDGGLMREIPGHFPSVLLR